MSVVKSAEQSPGRRHDVLRALKAAHSPMSIATIADTLDAHPNTVRVHLDTWVTTGRVEQVAPDRKGPGRPELAESQKAVVCPVHLGLMRGALETWEAPVTVDRLDAFVEPDPCLVQLTRQAAAT
jgi:predicted ArsR family transcriptional regulator